MNIQSRLMKYAKRLCLALALFLVGLPSLYAESEAERLSASLAEIRTLKAKVRQLIIDQEGRELQETAATLIMQRPDKFYWETSEPFAQLMVTNGSLIWIYEPDLEQVTIRRFDRDVERTPVLLLTGSAESLSASYEISLHQADRNTLRFVLLPKSEGSLFERLSLSFIGGALAEMQFEDSLGQKTSLSFQDHVVNESIEPAVFEFKIPEGIEVIDAT